MNDNVPRYRTRKPSDGRTNVTWTCGKSPRLRLLSFGCLSPPAPVWIRDTRQGREVAVTMLPQVVFP